MAGKKRPVLLDPLDPDQARKVAAYSERFFSDEEIASALGISHDTFLRRRKASQALCALIEAGKARGRGLLRSAQFDLAVSAKNPTMMIWLGKQYLGQKDSIEHSGPGGGAIPLAVCDAIAEATEK